MDAATGICEYVEVLAPRPYVPGFLPRLRTRWGIYGQMSPEEVRNGVRVTRPAYLQIPGLSGSGWVAGGKVLASRAAARRRHRSVAFDAVLAFDVAGVGGVAWRIARDLRIPAGGWALGGDVRAVSGTPLGRRVAESLKRLDMVFYQSAELRSEAAALLGISPDAMGPAHRVLAHGIPAPPPSLDRVRARQAARARWDVGDDQLAIVYVGRLTRPKGVRELLSAFFLAASRDPRLVCILIGSSPEFDDTADIRARLQSSAFESRVRIVSAVDPGLVWENLCGADVFAFPSHKEGMPNSLLEALAMGLPAVAFAIPAAREIDAGSGSVRLVPPLDPQALANAILELAASPDARLRLGRSGAQEVFKRFMVRTNMETALRDLAAIRTRPTQGVSSTTLPPPKLVVGEGCSSLDER